MIKTELIKLNKSNSNIVTIILIFFVLILILAPNTTYAIATGTNTQGIMIQIKNNTGITVAWNTVLSLVNYFIIFVLIVIGLANILRINIETYAIKKILPSLIIAIVLANFSRLFCLAILEIVQILTVWAQHFGAAAGDFDNTISPAAGLIGAFYSKMFGAKTFTVSAQDAGLLEILGKQALGGPALGMITGFLLGSLLFIIAAIVLFILWFLLLIRYVVIMLLVAVSPLAFLSIALPTTNQYFKMWWDNFSKWVFMPVIAFFIMALGLNIAGVFSSDSNQGIRFFVLIGILIAAITVPFKLGGSIMGAWGNLGKLFARGAGVVATKGPRFAGGVIEKVAPAGGATAGLNTFGKNLKKYGSYTDVGKYIGAGKKILSTLEEDSQAQAMREVGGSPLMRKYIAPDFFNKLVYERSHSLHAQRSTGDIIESLQKEMDDGRLANLSNAGLQAVINGDENINDNSQVAQLIERFGQLRKSRSPIAQAEAKQIRDFLDTKGLPFDTSEVSPEVGAEGDPGYIPKVEKGYTGWKPQASGGSAYAVPTGTQGGTSSVGVGGVAKSVADSEFARKIGEEVAKHEQKYNVSPGSTQFAQTRPEEQKDLYQAQHLARAQFGATPYLNDYAINDIAQESYMGSSAGALATKYAPKPGGAIDLRQAAALTSQIDSYQQKLKSEIPGFENIEENVNFSAKINPQNASQMKNKARELLNQFSKSFEQGGSPSSDQISDSIEIVKQINPKWKLTLDKGAINTTDLQRDLERAFKAASISEKLQNIAQDSSPEQINVKRKIIARQEYEFDNIKNSLSSLTQQLEKSIDSPESINIQKEIQVNLHNIADVSSKNSLSGDKASEISQNIIKSIQNDLKKGFKIGDIIDKDEFRDAIVKQVESAVSSVQSSAANQTSAPVQNTPPQNNTV